MLCLPQNPACNIRIKDWVETEEGTLDEPVLHRKKVTSEILPVGFHSFHPPLDNRRPDSATAFARTPSELPHGLLSNDSGFDSRLQRG